MGNTKTYYLEGTLHAGVTIEAFKAAVHEAFHSTYCVAEIVEEKDGYLAVHKGAGPFVVAAIHSYSLCDGVREITKLFSEFDGHRLDADMGDVWVFTYHEFSGLYGAKIDCPELGLEG